MQNEFDLNTLREALKVSPDNLPLLKIFAKICIAEWSLKEGQETYEKILKIAPQDVDAQLGVAQILYQMGKISEAGVRLENILQHHPDCAQAWLYASKISISEGNLPTAQTQYSNARQLDPSLNDGAVEKELKNKGLLFKESTLPKDEERLLNTGVDWVAENSDEDDQILAAEQALLRDVERPVVTFADVGGMEDVKEEIRLKIIYPSAHPEIYKAYGKKAGGGVLLYGPPGCGKTLISQATAGEIKANFISIGLHQILDMYIGNSEKNLHEIFELARSHAPSVLFVDEIDALAANRTDMRHSASRTIINQFLAEFDGDISSNEGVLILGATNAPWYIDPAFRRPGRFDRIIFIPIPDEKARIEILKILAKGKAVEPLDFKLLAQRTQDFSGADLKALFDLAVEATLSKAMQENRIIPLTIKDLLRQAEKITPSSKAWFESARNYALYANQSGLYDPILAYLGIKK